MKLLACVLIFLALIQTHRAFSSEGPNIALAKRDYTDTLKTILLLQDRARFMEATAIQMSHKANQLKAGAETAKVRAARIKRTVAKLRRQAILIRRQIAKNKKVAPFAGRATTSTASRERVNRALAMGVTRGPSEE
jgi:hypothetical protein